MQATGAAVYLALPAVPIERYSDSRNEINDLYQYLIESLKIPMLFEPEKALVPAADFFDTFYHLNTNGRERYTDILLNYLPFNN
ncbi:MAG: hypothetical protein Q7J65_01705 [Candidatus Marinimicrobia bacterium]|nr:hypothetical protein [Candidatus Neomarinimicrobiota bacterium]